ncbi:hypothetical protein KL86DYS1_30578 [uncultured Dysgonomonas sp.]|uniref:Uncharacterized protein n=1 Tax=uncultured Dysgonomonas sp. TaxID=206096 RepID=A0A212JVN8_9BACT|nr:hypothetical protein KL86DYS1_30578 [uncultured Dysgonomonas sp.]
MYLLFNYYDLSDYYIKIVNRGVIFYGIIQVNFFYIFIFIFFVRDLS